MGYVVTAMVSNSAGSTILGFHDQSAASETFDTDMAQVSGSSLRSTTTTWGSNGFVTTVISSNSAGYTVLGFRR